MNKLITLMLATSIMATGSMASQTIIGADYDASLGGKLNVNQNAELMADKTITLGSTAIGTIEDVTLKNSGTIKMSPTEGTTQVTATHESTTFYQYMYISTGGQVKRVWSATSGLTEFGANDFSSDLTSAGGAITDYLSGFSPVLSATGVFRGGTIDQNYDDPALKGAIIIDHLGYSTTGGHFLDQDTTEYTTATAEEAAFFTGKTPKTVLSQGNSGGTFSPDILNPEVMSTVMYEKDNIAYKLGN